VRRELRRRDQTNNATSAAVAVLAGNHAVHPWTRERIQGFGSRWRQI